MENQTTSQEKVATILESPKKQWIKPEMELMEINSGARSFNDSVESGS